MCLTNFVWYYIAADEVFVKSGGNITLHCSLLGHSYFWTKDDFNHLFDNHKYDGTRTVSLTVTSAHCDDSGFFRCIVYTGMGPYHHGPYHKLNIIDNNTSTRCNIGGDRETDIQLTTVNKEETSSRFGTDMKFMGTLSDVTIGIIVVGTGFIIIVIAAGVFAILCHLCRTPRRLPLRQTRRHILRILSDNTESKLKSPIYLPTDQRYEYIEIDEKLSIYAQYDNAEFSYEDLTTRRQYTYMPINQSINIDGNSRFEPNDYGYIDGQSSFQPIGYGYIAGESSFKPIDYGYIDGKSSVQPIDYGYIDGKSSVQPIDYGYIDGQSSFQPPDYES
ncbi:Hypothetical predicted protein [Mytilus galloprovincialis]|uniref:Immunoglobulin domain-containing protein n=1 Tax=Mytilus galloprovincialis TaxID=29158 RepID=A0A8B6CKX3_MYTGA|nr:Hypothetical predicted protein [Mytilus galloprovincialis]